MNWLDTKDRRAKDRLLSLAAQSGAGWAATAASLMVAQVAGQGANEEILRLLVGIAAIQGCQMTSCDIAALCYSKRGYAFDGEVACITSGIGAMCGTLAICISTSSNGALSVTEISGIFLSLFLSVQFSGLSAFHYYDNLSRSKGTLRKTGFIFGLIGSGSVQVIILIIVLTDKIGLGWGRYLLMTGFAAPALLQYIYIWIKNRDLNEEENQKIRMKENERVKMGIQLLFAALALSLLSLVSSVVRRDVLSDSSGINIAFYGIGFVGSIGGIWLKANFLWNPKNYSLLKMRFPMAGTAIAVGAVLVLLKESGQQEGIGVVLAVVLVILVQVGADLARRWIKVGGNAGVKS